METEAGKVGTFKIDGRLPGLNEIIGATNRNRWVGADLKRRETKRCKWAILAAGVPRFMVPVRISFMWIEKDRRRDPDNICAGAKFILDALVELQRIPNDSRRWIKAITHEFAEPDSNKPHVEVTINEAVNLSPGVDVSCVQPSRS